MTKQHAIRYEAYVEANRTFLRRQQAEIDALLDELDAEEAGAEQLEARRRRRCSWRPCCRSRVWRSLTSLTTNALSPKWKTLGHSASTKHGVHGSDASLPLHHAHSPPPPPPLLHLRLHLGAPTLLGSQRRPHRGHGARPRRDAQPGRRTPPVRRIVAAANPGPWSSPERLPRGPCPCSSLRRLQRQPLPRRLYLQPPVPRASPHGHASPLTAHTYGILMRCCCRARRPGLGLAFFGRLLRTGLRTDGVDAYALIKCFCLAKRTDEAVSVRLHRLPELGRVPDALSYSVVLKVLCDDGRSQRALGLLQMMWKEGGGCAPNVVAYSTVIHGFCKEGKVSKACELFNEMVQQGVKPNVVTYTQVIDALCKARAMDKAESFLRHMVDNDVRPNNVTYKCIIQGYSSLGWWEEAVKIFRETTSRGLILDDVTRNSFVSSLCNHGRSKEAAEIAHQIIENGTTVSISTYGIILGELCRNDCTEEAIVLFHKLGAVDVKFDITIFNTMIDAMYRVRRREEANILFAAISANGLVPNASTYRIMITNLLKEGSMEEADHMFSSMETSGYAPSSVLLNDIIRMLLEKGEIVKAGNYLSKVDGKSISLEASTGLLMRHLFSTEGKYHEQIKSLPEREMYSQEFTGASFRLSPQGTNTILVTEEKELKHLLDEKFLLSRTCTVLSGFGALNAPLLRLLLSLLQLESQLFYNIAWGSE
ncbi:protein Rf1, mitochondrial [Triticum aestivum]|uniref:protein Rf1, mitochondrial n=1 Tax=Triticum aestivum TaxID=4565 RepID=UPI001D01A227|nr:protein Rf1, mitochondrial-like [Triticum aestivum]